MKYKYHQRLDPLRNRRNSPNMISILMHCASSFPSCLCYDTFVFLINNREAWIKATRIPRPTRLLFLNLFHPKKTFLKKFRAHEVLRLSVPSQVSRKTQLKMNWVHENPNEIYLRTIFCDNFHERSTFLCFMVWRLRQFLRRTFQGFSLFKQLFYHFNGTQFFSFGEQACYSACFRIKTKPKRLISR